MCIICVDLDNGTLDPWEAARNRSEMAKDLDLDHLEELDVKISQALLDFLNNLTEDNAPVSTYESKTNIPFPLPGTGGSD